MGSSDNGVPVDDGTTAKMPVVELDRDNEGELASGGSSSTDNGLLRSILPLRSRSSRNEGRKGKGEDRLETHGEWS